MFRLIGSIVAGFVAIAVLSTATDAVMHKTGVFPPEGQPMANPLWVFALAYRVVYQVAGGYLTARLARNAASMRAVSILAVLGVILSFAGIAAKWNAGPQFGPRWYSIMLVILAAPTVWLGGRLQQATKPTARQ